MKKSSSQVHFFLDIRPEIGYNGCMAMKGQKMSAAEKRAKTKYNAKPEQVKNRMARNNARAKMEREGKVHKGDGKDVDHKNSNPRNNSKSNLRVQSKSTNRRRNGR